MTFKCGSERRAGIFERKKKWFSGKRIPEGYGIEVYTVMLCLGKSKTFGVTGMKAH